MGTLANFGLSNVLLSTTPTPSMSTSSQGTGEAVFDFLEVKKRIWSTSVSVACLLLCGTVPSYLSSSFQFSFSLPNLILQWMIVSWGAHSLIIKHNRCIPLCSHSLTYYSIFVCCAAGCGSVPNRGTRSSRQKIFDISKNTTASFPPHNNTTPPFMYRGL
jgi:hypothetical protein